MPCYNYFEVKSQHLQRKVGHSNLQMTKLQTTFLSNNQHLWILIEWIVEHHHLPCPKIQGGLHDNQTLSTEIVCDPRASNSNMHEWQVAEKQSNFLISPVPQKIRKWKKWNKKKESGKSKTQYKNSNTSRYPYRFFSLHKKNTFAFSVWKI